jgi:hypothetical protein
MFQGRIKLVLFIFIALTHVVLLGACRSRFYCYDQNICVKKYLISLQANQVHEEYILCKIVNRRQSSIKLTDSIMCFFYKFNQNLQRPGYDSSLENTPEKILVYPVDYQLPIILYKKLIDTPIVISSGDSYEFRIPTDFMLSTILEHGHSDNLTQLKTGFQLFIKGIANRKIQYHFGSNIFIVN